jgi:hypothetical protein
MGKGGHVNQKEPEGPEVMEAYEDTQIIFDRAGWYLFCTKMDGHHYATTREFAESFNGQWARITNLAMQFTEESIVVACNLPTDGERWFKNKLITGGDVNQFLNPEHRDPNWAKGIPRDWIVDEWMEALLMLKRFITCEGRYSIVFLFHLRFLLHLAGIKRMNLPYYFLRDLNKMAMRVQATPRPLLMEFFIRG